MVGRKEKTAAIILSAFFIGCGSGGDEACSNVAVIGDNSQATCNGDNTQQNGSGELTADQAADICCTQEKVDELKDDDCLKEIGYADNNLCRDTGSDSSNNSNSSGSTTLDFN